MFSRIFFERLSETYQLFSEGNYDLVLESCSDYWTGAALGSLNENVCRILSYVLNSLRKTSFWVIC